MNSDIKAYACYNINKTDRGCSSSGGIYILLARKVLENQGKVFAVCYDNNFEAFHKEIISEEDLLQSVGAKYMPSKLKDTFPKIKKYLSEGKQVMFVGTPCQCAGLKKYLGNEYDKLICVDIVCHGVPSRMVWRKYLQNVNNGKKLERLNMRDKSSGWSKYQYSWKLEYKDMVKLIPQEEIGFMKGFTSDYYLRPSCYKCQFKGIERKTDFTLGDYWGVWDIQPKMDDNKGTSLVLVHTSKGKRLFEKIVDNLVIQEANLEDAIRYNPSIIYSSEKKDLRKKFFKKMKSEDDIEKIVEEISKSKLSYIIKRKTKTIIKKLFGQIS